DHARDRKPDLGPRSRRVTAALPRGIGENRLPLRLAPADTPRRVAAAYADRHDAADEVAEERPFERLHPAHRTADREAHSSHAEPLEQETVQRDGIADRRD